MKEHYQDTIDKVFNALGLEDSQWQSLETIDKGCSFVLENRGMLESSLPKRCIGDMWRFLESKQAIVRRKSLLSFARRLAAECTFAIVRRRKQTREDNKTISRYSYMLITHSNL
jgi:hypothetical protein